MEFIRGWAFDMMKKKAGKIRKNKGQAKISGKKTIRVKQMDIAKVRNDVTNIVGAGAKKITQAVVEEAQKGQLAPMKYLFEMAGVYPAPVSEKAPEVEDDGESFAKLVYETLNAAKKPAVVDEVESEESVEKREETAPVVV